MKLEGKSVFSGIAIGRCKIFGKQESLVKRSKVEDTAGEINAYFQQLGFTYVTLDLGGYKMGSMNKTLPVQK